MMKKNKKRGFAVLLFGMVLVAGISCEGPTGETGPQGEAGPQGDAGPAGPPGTANVIYSEWVALSELETASDTVLFGRNYMKYDIPASVLTQEIIEMGTVLVYFRISGTVVPLPATFGGGNPIYITFSLLQPGEISVLSQNLDNTATGLNLSIETRYILIPGGATASKANPPDFKDYYAVLEYYNIDP